MRDTLSMIAAAFALAFVSGCAQVSRGAGEPSQNARRSNSNRGASANARANTNVNSNVNAGSNVNANAAASRPALTDADYARHVEQLKKRLPSENFHVVVERPFVVVGDGGRRAVEEHA